MVAAPCFPGPTWRQVATRSLRNTVLKLVFRRRGLLLQGGEALGGGLQLTLGRAGGFVFRLRRGARCHRQPFPRPVTSGGRPAKNTVQACMLFKDAVPFQLSPALWRRGANGMPVSAHPCRGGMCMLEMCPMRFPARTGCSPLPHVSSVFAPLPWGGEG